MDDCVIFVQLFRSLSVRQFCIYRYLVWIWKFTSNNSRFLRQLIFVFIQSARRHRKEWLHTLNHHCVKSVRTRNYSGSHFPRIFPVFSPNAGKYGHFSRSARYILGILWNQNISLKDALIKLRAVNTERKGEKGELNVCSPSFQLLFFFFLHIFFNRMFSNYV